MSNGPMPDRSRGVNAIRAPDRTSSHFRRPVVVDAPGGAGQLIMVRTGDAGTLTP